MSDASTMYETREAIEAQVERARRMRGSDRPALTAFSPMGLYLAIAVAIVIGAEMNIAPDVAPSEQATTMAQLAKAQ